MNVKNTTAALLLLVTPLAHTASTNSVSQPAAVARDFSQPISLADALDITLQSNAAILKAKSDLEANQGIIMQTRAVALPRLGLNGNYTAKDPNSLEIFPTPRPINLPDQNWSVNIQITQS